MKEPPARQPVRLNGLQARPDLNGLNGTIGEFDKKEGRWAVHMEDGTRKLLKAENLENLRCAPPEAPILRSPIAAFTANQRVITKGCVIRPDLNGQIGSIIEWDAGKDAWRLRMDDGTCQHWKSDQLQAVSLEDDPEEAKRVANREAKKRGPSFTSNPDDADYGKRARMEQHERSERQRMGLQQFLPGQEVRVKGLLARPDLNGQKGTIVELDFYEGRWKVRMQDGTGKLLKTENLEIIGTTARLFPPTATNDAFKPGLRVRVKGLQSRPDLNGQGGSVLEPVNYQGRWKVLLDDGTSKLLKTENLEVGDAALGHVITSDPAATKKSFRIGQRVTVKGLQLRTDVNRKHGTILEEENDQGRWTVRMDDGSRKGFFAMNLEELDPKKDPLVPKGPVGRPIIGTTSFSSLCVGRQVRLKGLQTRSELNGQIGPIVGWDETECRWKVGLKDGTTKNLKAENLEVVDPNAEPVVPKKDAAVTSEQTEPSDSSGIRKQVRVKMRGLMERGELNNQSGTVIERDMKTGRWRVRMDDGSTKLCQAHNLEIFTQRIQHPNSGVEDVRRAGLCGYSIHQYH